MKKYQKAQMIAKNLPTGSYAAGCPSYGTSGNHGPGKKWCKDCERAF